MADITSLINDILTDNYLISAGNIDTFEEKAIERVWQFLGDCGVPFTKEILHQDHIAVFSWIEYNKPCILVFKFE